MATATVSARTKSPQVKSTRKPILNIAPVAKKAPKPKAAKRKRTTPSHCSEGRFNRRRFGKVLAAVKTLNLAELDSLIEHFETGNGQARYLPISRAIGKLPEDIRERIYQLTENVWATVQGMDFESNFVCAALELADALKPDLVASQETLKRIAEGRLETGESHLLGSVEKIGTLWF